MSFSIKTWLWVGSALLTLAPPSAQGSPQPCIGINEAADASEYPQLAPSPRKAELIAERSKERRLASNLDPRNLSGLGGFFVREYTLESGERVMVTGLSEIRGQVFYIRFFTLAPILKHRVMFWQKEYLDVNQRAQSSAREVRQMLQGLKSEVQSYGLTVLVLEGQRVTGARSGERPHIQVVMDLQAKADFPPIGASISP